MNKKAQQFQDYLQRHQLAKSFSINEHNEGGRNFVLFNSAIETGTGHFFKLVVILEEGLQTIIRVWLTAEDSSDKKNSCLLDRVNILNTHYRSFKFFLDDRNNIVMDWINSNSDDSFDPDLVHFMLGVVNREAKTLSGYLTGSHPLSSLSKENYA
jgi:hypothetical protein